MLQIENLTLWRQDQALVRNLSLSVAPGEIVTLTGASGSGKSTLFSWIVGALPDAFRAEGRLWLDGRRCDTLPVEDRRIGILFQDALLFDHFSVGQNLLVAMPSGGPPGERRMRAEAALESAGLAGFYKRDPATLSGGQRARVALLRALLAQPQALLLDEPFSRLDADLRARFRHDVFAAAGQQAIPVLLVTHDPADVPPGGRCLRLESWR